MPPPQNLIREIHRRSLWQVLGLYVAASWVVLQVVNEVTDSVGLPDWVSGASIVLLLVGFPIVLATAFLQHGAREGQPSVSAADSGTGAASGSRGASAEAVASVPGRPEEAEPTATPERTQTGTPHRLFTWRNALLGGGAAFALLGVVTAAWMIMRAAGIGPAGTLVAKGVIEEGERAILAEFENLTADSLLGEVVTEAFRVDLAQTPVISLVEPAFVGDVLDRMERPADTRLDPGVAREVAVREGIKAVVAGEVGTAGGAYVLSARVLAADTGDELVSLRETASDSSEIVPAIDDLSGRLRERLGESLRSLRGGEPLERVTTGSLEALRKYSQALTAINRGEGDKGTALLEEAIEIDSTFAMAWRKLSTRVEGERQIEAATRAYELRDRLTDRERYHTIGNYHFYVTRDFDRSVTAYQTLLDSHPNDGLALYNMAIARGWMGERERAVDAVVRSRDAGYAGVSAHMNAVRWNYGLGRAEEARAALARLSEDRAGHPVTAREQWAMAMLEGDLETARSAASRLLDHDVTGWSDAGRFFLAVLELSRGRVAAAEAQVENVRGASELEKAIGGAWNADLYVRGDTVGARRRVEAGLERASDDELELLDRYQLVRLYARAGQVSAARSLLREIEAGLDSLEQYFPWVPRSRTARGEILIAEGRFAEAIDEFRAYERERGPVCDLGCNVDEQARAFDRAGERDSAIAYYERYVRPERYGRAFDMHHVPPIYQRLGELYDEAGDLENAARYYAAFVEMWSDADEELQPRVRAAQARLEEILRETG